MMVDIQRALEMTSTLSKGKVPAFEKIPYLYIVYINIFMNFSYWRHILNIL